MNSRSPACEPVRYTWVLLHSRVMLEKFVSCAFSLGMRDLV